MKTSILTSILASFLVISIVAAAANDDENWTIRGYIADNGLTTLNLSATGASSLTSSDVLTLTSGATAIWGTSAGDLTIDSAGLLNLGTVTTSGITMTTDATGDGELIVPTGSISSTEITDGTLLFTDIAQNGCLTDDIIQWNGAGWVCAEPSVPLNNILSANGANTITNGAFGQVWNWALDGNDTALTIGESSASTGTGNILLEINTATGTTARPFQITNNAIEKLYVSAEGNDLFLDANGSTTDIASLLFSGTAGTGDFRIGADGGDIFWQGGGGRVLQVGSYWPTVLSGNAQTPVFPAFINGGGLYAGRNTIIVNPTGRTGDATLTLRALSSQTGNLTQWEDSAGTILSSVNASGHLTIGENGAAITRHLSGTGSINFNKVDGTCNTGTIGVANAAIGDTVVATPTPTTNGVEDFPNLTWSSWVSSAGTVSIRLCDIESTGPAVNPGVQTWRVDVWQH